MTALRRLSDIQDRDGFKSPSLSDRAISGAVALVTSSADARTRRGVLDILAGARDERLFDTFSNALLYDPDEQVRSAALVGLANYNNDVARAVIAAAAGNDESATLRKEARWASLDAAGQRALIMAALLDRQLPVDERLAPLEMAIQPRRDRTGADDVEGLLTNDVVTAIGEALVDVGRPGRRNDLLNQLRPYISPALVPVFIARLQDDADVQVRITAIRTLQLRIDAPGVRQALLGAAVNDPDERVRQLAEQVLANPAVLR